VGSADSLLAATIYLMSCYAGAPCARIAGLIERHLAALARDAEGCPLVRETGRRLQDHWHALSRACPATGRGIPCLLDSTFRDP
jgi:hypothetical protein